MGLYAYNIVDSSPAVGSLDVHLGNNQTSYFSSNQEGKAEARKMASTKNSEQNAADKKGKRKTISIRRLLQYFT